MKRTFAFVALLSLGAAFAWLIEPTALAQSANPPTTLTCSTMSTVLCIAGGVCTGVIPDAGTAEGVASTLTRSYYIYSCPPVGQAITATGTFEDYHCHAADGKCAIVAGNTQSVTTATLTPNTVAAGAGNGAPVCWESQPFTIPYYDNTGDRIVVRPNGITVSPTDGGSLITKLCPAQ